MIKYCRRGRHLFPTPVDVWQTYQQGEIIESIRNCGYGNCGFKGPGSSLLESTTALKHDDSLDWDEDWYRDWVARREAALVDAERNLDKKMTGMPGYVTLAEGRKWWLERLDIEMMYHKLFM